MWYQLATNQHHQQSYQSGQQVLLHFWRLFLQYFLHINAMFLPFPFMRRWMIARHRHGLQVCKISRKFCPFFRRKSNWSKFEIFITIRNFGQNSKFWSKLEVLVKTRNFGQNAKLFSELEILVKTRNFSQNSKF